MSGTRRKAGRLGPQVEGYRAWLAQRGYTPQTVRNMLKDLGQVGVWMSAAGLETDQLDEDAMVTFLAARQAAGRRRALGPRAMIPLLTYLRDAGVTPAALPPQTPAEALLAEYRTWLVQERGLAPATVLRYENTARRFLQQQAMAGGALQPAGLTGADVNEFLLRECGRVSAGSAKGRVAELRAVLRFLYLQGLTPLRLGTAVPPVGGWRLATLPLTMTAADVQLLLDSCDRSTGVGVRDLAIMTLVARLGLRSVEVARLELADVDGRAGELVVRGKARRQDRLPLPAEAGEAMAAYLARGRAPAGTRRLFLTCKAPRGPGRGRRGAGVPAGGPATGGAAPAAACAGSRTAPPGRRAGRDQPGASPPGPGHHGPVCQGRPEHAAARRPALAGNSPVTALEQYLADYLQLRHSLGHQLAEAGWLLPGFVAHLDACGLPTVTIEAALAWAQQAPVSPQGRVSTIGARRMTAARGFARYLSGIDPATQVPPLGLMPHRARWRQPFIYTTADISTLLEAARNTIASPLRAATYQTLIGLLASSGLRIGEAIKLDRADIDWAQGVLLIRESKFGKSRLVPLHPTSVQALDCYARLRDEFQPHPAEPAFFISLKRKRLLYAVVQETFRQLIDTAGIGAAAPSPPRLHDLRHSFAVRTLLGWYREQEDVQSRIPSLSTYLGHREPSSTYWYLSAAPELLALAAARQDTAWLAARS